MLWALDGQIVGQPQLIPVRGATAVKGANGSSKVKAHPREGKSLIDRIEAAVRDGYDSLTHKQAGELVVSLGGTKEGTSTQIKTLIKRGVLSDPPGRQKGGSYTVNR